jgi:hypothetical protein
VLLELLFGTFLHALPTNPPHSLSHATSCLARPDDSNPIANARCRRTTGFLQTALSDLIRPIIGSLRKALLAEQLR